MKTVPIIFLAALLTTISCGSLAAPGELRMATAPGYPPFEYKTAAGELAGFDVDVGNAICKRMKLKCVWAQQPFDSLVAGLKARKFDVLNTGLTITERRRQVIDYTDPVYSIGSQLVARKGSDIDDSPASLKGRRVGTLQGSVQADYARQHWRDEGVKLVFYGEITQAFVDLKAGRLDAAFVEQPTASTGFLDKPEGQDFEFVGKPFSKDPTLNNDVAMGLRKGSDELRDSLNRVIAEMQRDGTIEKLSKKYFQHGGITLLQPETGEGR